MEHLKEAKRLIREAKTHIEAAQENDPDENLDNAMLDLDQVCDTINDVVGFRIRRSNRRDWTRQS